MRAEAVAGGRFLPGLNSSIFILKRLRSKNIVTTEAADLRFSWLLQTVAFRSTHGRDKTRRSRLN
jgi:hypothetical protein